MVPLVGISAGLPLRMGPAVYKELIMGRLKVFALAGAMFAGATAVASAADLGPPPLHGGLPPAPYAAPIAEVSGWYLRGDIGVAYQTFKPQLEDARFTPRTVNQYELDLSKVGFASIGVGYQLNSWLRADVTAEKRFQQNFKFNDKSCFGTIGGVAIARPGAACPSTATLTGLDNTNFYDGNLNSNVFLANAYVDLGNWGGFTPFVGAGIGAAQHSFAKVTDVGASNNYVAGVFTGVSSSNLVRFYNRNQTNMAWALMAGVAYDASATTKIEFGYRYLNMGKAKQYVFNCVGGVGVAGTCGDYLHYKNLQAHEFKLGVRWMLGGTSYTPVPVQAASYPAEPPRMIKKF
jgi:opacity protein-like surface antigen